MDSSAATAAFNNSLSSLNTPLAVTASSEVNTRHIFPFEKLAPELRNQIYEEVLVADRPISIIRYVLYDKTTGELDGTYEWTSKVKIPAGCRFVKEIFPFEKFHNVGILRLNRTIYKETHAMLYARNKFTFANPTVLASFVGGPRSTLSKLIVDIGLDQVTEKGSLTLMRLPALQHLRLRLSTSWSTLDWYPRPIYENCLRHVIRHRNLKTCGHGYYCICASNPSTESLAAMLELDMGRLTVYDQQHMQERKFNPDKDMQVVMGFILERWVEDVAWCRQHAGTRERKGD
jgi:hypothetical protein